MTVPTRNPNLQYELESLMHESKNFEEKILVFLSSIERDLREPDSGRARKICNCINNHRTRSRNEQMRILLRINELLNYPDN